VALLSRLWTNDVETGASPAYPDVRPLDLDLPADDAYRAALSAARSMPRWTILDEDAEARRFHAEARTRRVGFVDDVEVWVEPLARTSRISARSASRVGFTDLGTNARRLRAYLTHLAERS
jgi:uncharacterized protein (DUF1499 family)